jgi:hypothetical protein
MIQQNLAAERHPMRSNELKHCTRQSTQNGQESKIPHAQYPNNLLELKNPKE